MPSEILTVDESLVLRKYRQARGMGHSGIEIAIKDGELVKLELVEKVNLENLTGTRRLKESSSC